MDSGGKKKKTKKESFLETLIVILINVIIVGYIAMKELGGKNASENKLSLSDINFWFIACGVLCFAVAVAMETIKYKDMIFTLEKKKMNRVSFECAVLGKYYDNITPLGAGGQPFQMSYLSKRGMSNGTSGALPVMGFLSLQTAFILTALTVFISNKKVADSYPVIRVSAYVGLGFYIIIPLAIVLFALMPKTLKSVVHWGCMVLQKIHILKDGEASSEKVVRVLDEYLVSFNLLKGHRFLFLKQLGYSMIYQIAIMSIPFFMLRAFGSEAGWWSTFCTVVYVYSAITIIPTPGNSGAAEGVFYAAFSSLDGSRLFWGMISWRILVYYSWLLLGLTVVIVDKIEDAIKKRRAKKSSS
ncbi:MAG: lysylphosphatidylglycerol synthase transmembrane domain-containing protein [Oscillospiraceae bacterium]|jgi:uncharacterized protein (TIRG00374 family)